MHNERQVSESFQFVVNGTMTESDFAEAVAFFFFFFSSPRATFWWMDAHESFFLNSFFLDEGISIGRSQGFAGQICCGQVNLDVSVSWAASKSGPFGRICRP
jgi:hypothetical protein